LIEAVALKIIQRIRARFPEAKNCFVRVTKINAPMGGQVQSVSVEMNG
jgi:dihydroneopterin aldolase